MDGYDPVVEVDDSSARMFEVTVLEMIKARAEASPDLAKRRTEVSEGLAELVGT